jgi:Mg-chelatase subunit ChlD
MRMNRRAVALVLAACCAVTLGVDARQADARPQVTSSAATALPAAPGDADGGDQTVTKVSGTSATPLVVVFDLSGSMNEDDGTGTVKLDGAKEALTSLMARQVAGTSIGLWTYPGNYGGAAQISCSPGYWVPGAALGDFVDPERLSATINSLAADGDTPTGPALQAVGAELRAAGAGEAVVLLVSDGLSNCGPPPCDVAKELVADGFDITVQAMGFQIEADGREELECVASATDGTYYDVADSEQLAETLDELGVAGLELEISSPGAPVAAGMVVTVTASVSNPSAREVPDVTISMVGLDADTRRTLFPAVVPPRYRVGNLPGGLGVTRSWDLVVGTIDAGGLARFRITAGSPAVGAVSQEIEIRVVTADGLSSEDAWIADIAERGETLLIMGDSYSSGEGAGSYVDGTDTAGNHCHRSFNTYVAQIMGDKYVDIVACSGAVVSDFFSPSGQNSVPSQQDQLEDAQKQKPIGAVFLTMGGNDVGFADIVVQCLIGSLCAVNPALHADVQKKTAQLPEQLASMYLAIDRTVNSPAEIARRGDRVAPIVVLPYPGIVPSNPLSFCMDFDPLELSYANAVLTDLNAAVSKAVTQANLGGALGLLYASPVVNAVKGHTACDWDPYVNVVTFISGVGTTLADKLRELTGNDSRQAQEFMHPNKKGHLAITNTLFAWAPRLPVKAGPLLSGPDTPLPASTRVDKNPTTVTMAATGTPPKAVALRRGDAVTTTVSGLAPGSHATLALSSLRRVIAYTEVDQDGNATLTGYVPADLDTGKHELKVEAFTAEWEYQEQAIPVAIAAAKPWWVWVVPAAAGVALLGALVVMWFGLGWRLSPRVPQPKEPKEPKTPRTRRQKQP